ncbi:MAG TPA: signal recognition particle-docking protein FtsY, partial [Syntrophomonas sp.]|nr:signal recognition particle-docking protein FtsY [Syntrophomonas sp.]
EIFPEKQPAPGDDLVDRDDDNDTGLKASGAAEETRSDAVEAEAVGEDDDTETPENAAKAKKGIFERFKLGLSKTRQNVGGKIDALVRSTRKLDEEFFEELEEILIQADVGMDTSLALVDKIRTTVKKQKINDPLQVTALLQDAVAEVLGSESTPLVVAPAKPTVILVVGVNGAGKTTTIAKLAHKYKQEQHKVLLAAGDTFRAAAIDQLQIWADRIGVELIQHQEGADPGAVVFDAISAARARKADILIIDTAGRLQNKTNLMKEISKIRKVIEKEMPSAPHEVLLVLDATTGQNAISQARIFSEATGVSGIVLTKLDGTAKGGIVIAVARELGIPVKLVGIGEGMEDLREFSPEVFARALFEGDA